MKRNGLKVNYIYQMFYRILTLITPLLTSPYLSRILGSEKLGIYSFTLSLTNLFLMIAYLGVDNYGCRTIAQQYAKKENRLNVQKVFWEIYTMQFITSVIASLLFLFYILFFVKDNLLMYCIQSIALLSAMLDINWYFFGTEQFPLTVIRNTIIKVISIILIFVCVHTESDLPTYAFIMVLSTFFSQMVLWKFLFKDIKFEKINLSSIKKHIKQNIMLFIPVIAITIYHTMDKTMLGILSNYFETGYYYNADKIINMPLTLITGLGIVMLPRMARVLSGDDKSEGIRLLNKSFELNMFLAFSMSLGIAAISDEFVPFFFGEGFAPCINLIKIFAPVLVIKCISGLIETQYLIPCNNEIIYIKATFLGAVVNIVFNLWLIPLYGAMGATIATLMAEIIVLIVEAFAIRKQFSCVKQIKNNIIYLFASIIMFFTVRLFSNYTSLTNNYKLICEMIIGIIVYFLIILPYWCKNKTSIFNYVYVKLVKLVKDSLN